MSMEVGIHVPEIDNVAGIPVRPDVLIVAVSARVEDVSPSHAVALFKNTAAKLQGRVIELHRQAEVFARKLDLGRNSSDKSGKVSSADAQLDGVLYVPLAETLDYWARAELLAKVTEALRSFSAEAYKSKPSIRFSFRAPVPRVRDVTAHKVELSTRFAAQWRALLGNGEGTLAQASWEIPDEVAQVAVSLEEVRLVLVSRRK